MACAIDVDHFINCKICFEPYERPQMLPCMHTFCLKCVDKIKQEQHIDCPLCQKHCSIQDLKLDFRTAALVESYQNQLAQVSTKESNNEDSQVKCESCEDPNVNVRHKCETCDLLLCEKCEASHRGENYDGDFPHVVKTIASIAGGIKKEIQEVIKELNMEEEILSAQLSNRHKELDVIRKTCDDANVKITEQKDKLIAQIISHHDNLHKKVESEKVKCIKNDKQKYKVIEFNNHDIKDKQMQLNSWVRNRSDMSIVSTAQLIREKLQQEITKPHASEKGSASIEPFAVNVTVGEDYDVTHATKVTFSPNAVNGPTRDIDGKEQGKQDSASSSNKEQQKKVARAKTCNYTSAEYRDYKMEKTVTLSNTKCNKIKSIKHHNNHIYYMSSGKIYVYSNEMILVKTISHNVASCSDFICINEKYFIVASVEKSSGLSLLDSEGKLLQVISHGEFVGVGIYKHKLYAYEYKYNQVFIFEQTVDFFWKQARCINIKYRGTNKCNSYEIKLYEIKSFGINDTHIYITDETSLYELDFEGTLKRKLNCRTDENKHKAYEITSFGNNIHSGLYVIITKLLNTLDIKGTQKSNINCETPIKICGVDGIGNVLLVEPENRRVILVNYTSYISKGSVLKLRGEALNHILCVVVGDNNDSIWVSHHDCSKSCSYLTRYTATNIHEAVM